MGKPADGASMDGLIALVEPELGRAGPGSWTVLGRCTETDPEAFFPPRGDPGRAARAVCAGCEVRARCLAYATVSAGEIYGIWGGLSRMERIRLRDALRARRAAGKAPDQGAA